MNWARWCSGKKLGKRIEKYSLTDYLCQERVKNQEHRRHKTVQVPVLFES